MERVTNTRVVSGDLVWTPCISLALFHSFPHQTDECGLHFDLFCFATAKGDRTFDSQRFNFRIALPFASIFNYKHAFCGRLASRFCGAGTPDNIVNLNVFMALTDGIGKKPWVWY